MVRIITILLLVALPWAAHADAATADAATTTPAQTASGSPLQNTGASAGSGQTSGILQPAETGTGSSLQSANASAGGVAQSGTEDIQQSGPASAAKLLIGGDADVPQTVSSQGLVVTGLGYLLIGLLVTTAITAVVWLLERRQLRYQA